MELEKMNLKFQQVAAKISKAYSDFKKHDKARKTEAYRENRLKELEELEKEYLEYCTYIDTNDGQQDTKLEELRTNTDLTITKYRKQLKEIPNDQQGQEHDDQLDDETTTKLEAQEVRFAGMQRIFDQIHQKRNNNEQLSVAWCKIKIETLNKYYERALLTHEELGTRKLPRSYHQKQLSMEYDYDEAIVTLQESVVPLPTSESIKLPRLEIQKFAGDYFQWVNFRDLFQASVIDNKRLVNAQRMQLLKTHLSGEAEGLIKHLTLTDNDFSTAWARLKNRYENEKVIVQQHLRKLITQGHLRDDSNESNNLKRLLDTTEQILAALKNLGRPVESWDDWIVITICHKLNEQTRREWEKRVGHDKVLPTWEVLKEFLEEEYRIQESLETRTKKRMKDRIPAKTADIKVNQISLENAKCQLCNQKHTLFECEKFKKMTTDERWEVAKKGKLCFRCLSVHQDKLSCNREKACKHCNKGHNTWLHNNTKNQKPKSSTTEKPTEISTNLALIQQSESIQPSKISTIMETTNLNRSTEIVTGNVTLNPTNVLLATAIVAVVDDHGQKILLRALIDFGSQGSMITNAAARLMGLKPINNNTTILPVGGRSSMTAQLVTLTIKPRFESPFELSVECYCLQKIMKSIPEESFEINWSHVKGIRWADPHFNKIGTVDILLGAENIDQLLKSGVRKGGIGEPVAQETELGWIVSGRLNHHQNRKCKLICSAGLLDLQESIEKIRSFWESEELYPTRDLTADEIKCDELYNTTYSRDARGYFTVRIPFKNDEFNPKNLGESKKRAMARFGQLEAKLTRNTELKTEYIKVMQEYISLGHMVEVDDRAEKAYYIPHHAVIKPESLTTKTRVVFDASAKTTSGLSLNDTMFIGARQQEDLFVILTRWRTKKIVFKADIEKMYRQIQLHPQDRKYHTILWRNEPTHQLKEYQMTTVTFGTASAPYLATKTLNQIAKDGEGKYPLGSQIIKNDFYVDDLISGAHSIEEAIRVKNEVITLLNGGCMKLRKWTSNDKQFLETLPTEDTEKSLQLFTDTEDSKTLGLRWNPKQDTFHFQVSWYTESEVITKRKLLSELSRLFDPLGWLAPVVLKAKLLMTNLWDEKIGWDEEIPELLNKQWIEFRDDIVRLGEIKIPRWIQSQNEADISLHGFCDGSDKAYAGVVYTRVRTHDKTIITLIASKTRVASKKVKLTTPKIELCGAELLSNLLMKIKTALNLDKIKTYAWSDSTAALGWIKGNPGRWKTFVANRVIKIQQNDFDTTEWNYVKTDENPADCASRGIMPNELINHPLWWEGPQWLKNDPSTWQRIPISDPQIEVRKQIMVNLVVIEDEIIQRFSSWNKLLNVMTWVRRWKTKVKGPLSASELIETRNLVLKQCQEQHFTEEIQRLSKKKPIQSSSHIIRLTPLISDDGLLRVGGRLENSDLSYDTKHPILLPSKSHVSKLITRAIHEETAHGGPPLMTTILRKTYWIIRGKRIINETYKSCIKCKRQAGNVASQLMSDLPSYRVTYTRPFLQCGVDYTGGYEIRSSRLRKAPTVTGYVALYICLSTKAVHLELVSDQTTDAFLAALQRFTARRGICSDIFSDNGTNLVGAANKLEKELLLIRNKELANNVAIKGINWHFIPPASPHKGGIWERNIGVMKTHLKRVLGTTKLTFEEFATVLCQIEATLNSRPIGPMNEDPENLNVLTPGHFLIGDALLAPPDILNPTRIPFGQRWKHLQSLHQHFWTRWSTEYLTMLQQRSKWTTDSPNVEEGDIVLIKEDNLPPRKWELGRIKEAHKTADGRVRVVTIKTAKGETSRSVNKICPLLENEPRMIEAEDEDLTESAKAKKKKGKLNLEKPQQTYWNDRTLRPRPLKNMLWAAMIALMIIFGGGFGNPITKTEFTHQPGIYFENLGSAGVITTNWHIYLNIDLTRYYNGIKKLQSSINELKEVCGRVHHCIETMTTLNENINELKQLDELMSMNSRRRRAVPFGIVGWAEHELFGTMNQDNAEHIETQFSEVHRNENHLLTLIRNQTSLLDITASVIERTEQEINDRYKEIGALITNITNSTSQSEDILGMTIYLGLVTKKFETLKANLMDMLTDLHQGHVNPRLFTPDQFLNQLHQITNNLPVGTIIPEKPQNGLRRLYKLLTGTARILKKRIVFDMSLPLISSTEFRAFRALSIPTRIHGNHSVTIVPETEVILITLEKDKFYNLNWNDYMSCVQISNVKRICNIQSPMYHAQSDKSRCTRDLLNHGTRAIKFCKFRLSSEEDVWIQLQRRNQWIYQLTQEYTLNVICDGHITSIQVKGTGSIEIKPGCSNVNADMTIMATTNKNSTGVYDFNPILNLSAIVTTLNDPVLNFTLDHSHILQEVHQRLKEIDDQTTLEQIQHYGHFGIISIVWIIIFAITILILIYRDQVKKIWLHMSNDMVTSSNSPSVTNWQHGLRKPLTTESRSRSTQMFTVRGEDVNIRHETI